MISVFFRNAILDKLLKGVDFDFDVYVALHDADPGVTGDDEISGGSYVRKLVAAGSWGSAVAAQSANNAVVVWLDMPTVDVSHFSIWDAVSGGNFLVGGPLDSTVSVTAGDGFVIPFGELIVLMEQGSE